MTWNRKFISAYGKYKWSLIISLFSVITLVAGTILAAAVKKNGWADWTGLGGGEVYSITIGETLRGENEVSISEPGKTLWDWLSLLGVPVTLTLLGIIFQVLQQIRVERNSREQSTRASSEEREEILQVYIDRLSALLVDQNILAIAVKLYESDSDIEQSVQFPKESPINSAKTFSEEEMLFDAAVDVIRARTLSILRRFEKDGKRKGSIIRFLVEAEIISKARLSLREADLSEAELDDVDLSGIDLSRAILTAAKLSGAKLIGAKLSGAKLIGANLSDADLSMANLSSADLSNAKLINVGLVNATLIGATLTDANLFGAGLIDTNLTDADLSGADLSEATLIDAVLSRTTLSEAKVIDTDLRRAKLCQTKLPDGIKLNPNRNCEELGIDPSTGIPYISSVDLSN